MKKYGLFLIVLVFVVVNTNAQFKLKIPKIKKPKVNKTKANNPTNNSNSKGSLTKSREMVIDDGFTFFDAEPVSEYDQKQRGDIDVGWTLKTTLRLMGTFPNRSGFNLIVLKDGKQMTKIRCGASIYQKEKDPNLSTPQLRKGKDLNFDNYMTTRGCWNKKYLVKGTGEFDIKVFYRNGDTDEQTLVRTYKIDVHRAGRVRGIPAKPQPDVAHYYISRHAEVPASFLYLAYGGVNDYFFSYNASPPGENRVEVYFSYTPKTTTSTLPQAYARCSVNGKRLKLPGPSPYADQVNFLRKRQELAIYTDRLATQYKRGSAYKDEISFKQVRATLPLSFGNRYTNRLKIEDHPGDWQCDISYNGEKIRTFRWKIGSDGKPVPHAEQASENVNLYYNGFMVETEIPEGGSEYDYRLAPMANKGLFYGIPWQSTEGKAMAAKVPTKGNAFHVASNKVK